MPNQILSAAIEELLGGADLDSERTAAVLAEIMAGRGGEAQTAAFLIALRAKGETAAELVGLARTMREFATPVDAGRDDLVDTAGTGGGVSTFNVSTTAALVAAAAGCAVAKHGNRSATSRSGSADVLEALGVRIDLDPAAVAESIRRVGFGFMFAPSHHPATKHVVPVRKALGVRTVFNFLGPLTNPAGARRQLIGISDPAFQAAVAEALAGLGCECGMVVCGDGLDEISASGETRVIEVGDRAREYTLTPEELGLERVPIEALRGGEPQENAETTRSILNGDTGPSRDVVLINAAAAIYVAGRADDLSKGLEAGREAIDSGAARDLLARLVETTAELAPPR